VSTFNYYALTFYVVKYINLQNAIYRFEIDMAVSGIVATGKFILTLAIASVLVLVFSMIFGPMFAIMKLGTVRDLLMFIFPKGLLLVVFFVALARYYYELHTEERTIDVRRRKDEF